MQKLILIKYGELSTKKDNINFFIKTLKDNIEKKIGDKAQIDYDYGRMFIIPNSDNFEEVLNILSNVFGIHEIVVAYKISNKDIDTINRSILDIIKDKDFKTFKVDVKRSDKTYPFDGMELRKIFGSYILKNTSDLKVDVNNPDIIVNVEIRRNEVLLYMDKIKGLGGYPVGTLGKGILMLSGGIDSPVAGYLAIKRGMKLECVYFESPPHTSLAAKDKVLKLARVISKYNNDIKVHIINFTEIQEAIYKNIPNDYLITIMRRMMYRISAIIASKVNAKVIVNGESIGQVASQTLTSMSAINEVVNIPVIRPVACFDKLEIIDIAKKIDTYDISVLPYEDCCTIFVPKHPVINPDKRKCAEYESLINYEDMIYNAIKNHEVINITEQDNEYKDLL